MSTGGVGIRARGPGWWNGIARRGRRHALVLGIGTWLASIVIVFGGSGRTSLLGKLNGPDFVHFYTFGTLARNGRIAEAYDWQAFHTEQVALVPESKDAVYPPVYPPQAAVVFVPFSVLSFTNALGAWTALTILIYGFVVWRAWQAGRNQLTDRTLVFAAAAGFPPFWHVVMNGQATILILGACFLAWRALERHQPLLAGCALGLLAVKPQFGIPFAVIVLVHRDWRMFLGAAVSVAAQALVVWLVLGDQAFTGYYSMLPSIVAHADALEPKPFQSHSIRSLTRLLPAWAGGPVWALLSGVVLWRTTRAWSGDAPVAVRLGLAILASVLVNPHLIVYDAAILVLPLLWFGAWYVQRGDPVGLNTFGAVTYALVLTFLVPTAALIYLQLSVIVMLGLCAIVTRDASSRAIVSDLALSERSSIPATGRRDGQRVATASAGGAK